MSVIDSQVAMLSQVVAQGSLPLTVTSYSAVWVGELLNGVYIATLTSAGGVNVSFYLTVNGTVSPLLSGQDTAALGIVGTVLPGTPAAGAVSLTADGSKYAFGVTTGTAGGGATEWRITRLG